MIVVTMTIYVDGVNIHEATFFMSLSEIKAEFEDVKNPPNAPDTQVIADWVLI